MCAGAEGMLTPFRKHGGVIPVRRNYLVAGREAVRKIDVHMEVP